MSMSSLGYACYRGEFELVRWLVDTGGADVNQQDGAGATPLLQAVRGNHINILTFLLSKGAQTHVKDQVTHSTVPNIIATITVRC